MAVPSTIADLSVTAASNSPSGADTVAAGTGPDDYLRAVSAIIRREQAQATAVASATTVDLGAITTGNYVHITGTTTITGFGTVAAGIERTVVFDGALTLTHNSTSLILPGGANITTAAGDVAVLRSEGSGNWRCLSYQRASAKPQPIPSGTVMLFVQTTAPTGWTKSSAHDNKALRVVSGAAGSGGTVAFTTAFASKAVSGTVGDTTLTIDQIPSHTHTYNGTTYSLGYLAAGPGRDFTATTNATSGAAGTGGSHTHSFSGTAIDMAVQYVDVIIATKD